MSQLHRQAADIVVLVFPFAPSFSSVPPFHLLAASGRVRGQRGHVLRRATSLTSPLAHRHVPCVFAWCCWLLSDGGKPLVPPQQSAWASCDRRSRFSPSSSSRQLFLPSTLSDIMSHSGGGAFSLLVLSEKQLGHRRFFKETFRRMTLFCNGIFESHGKRKSNICSLIP